MRGSGALVAIAATLHACVQSMVGQLASLGMAASVALTGLFTAAWPMLVGLVGPLCVQWRCRGMAHAVRDRPLRQRRHSDPVAYHLWADSALLGPSAFAFLLRPTGGYGGGWVLCAVAALCVGISLMCPFSLAEAGEAFMAKTAGEDYPEPAVKRRARKFLEPAAPSEPEIEKRVFRAYIANSPTGWERPAKWNDPGAGSSSTCYPNSVSSGKGPPKSLIYGVPGRTRTCDPQFRNSCVIQLYQ
jgi:hypothetical protein